ncbi:aminodeoxychorismate synthase, component I [Shewanella sairae]|uniref:aminodeoxychorismate synthase n=1 Tax=Shewanella sairae TaxID=190310 RepID=A0ABQ4PIK1_9GAMM|nr:aminodeoxychorismate synthase component I [Shewanella sairae]MCL1129847.1 aminodeoxychorismate synthase component I [Shewanella sairae]GIU47375.1 aminodeoxychorismate synthase, component I [Shewanella sairae]
MNKMTQKAVFHKRLDWNLSTTEIFSAFADSQWAILLDSANADHCDARYDVICAEPIATLVTQNQSTIVSCAANRQPLISFDGTEHAPQIEAQQYCSVDNDPFALLNDMLAEYYPQSKVSPFIFSGGAMGSFSYDLGRGIESLPTIAANDITLPEMNVGLYDWALIFDYQQRCWHLVHYLSDTHLLNLETRLNALLLNKTAQQQPNDSQTNADFKLTSQWHNQLTKQQYQQRFERVKEYLLSGDCYQINLTQRFSAQYQGSEWQAYQALRETNGAPFSAFMRLAQHAILSISPERFIQHQQGQIQTKPIKGTMPRDKDSERDLQLAEILKVSTKDRAENLMIVDLLRNDIGKVAAAGSVRVPHLFEIESFPAVHHLVSTVTATLKSGLTPSDLLKACFPGGSITGAPKIRAMSIIEELEPSRRSLYCGSIGYISQDGNMDTSITIRTLVAERNTSSNDNSASGTLHCWAGGGIVADSKVDAEYQETFDKLSRILPILSELNQS